MHSFTFRGRARKPKESIEAHSENCVIVVMNFKPLFSRAKLCPVIWMDSDHPLSFPRCSLDSDISEIQAGPSRLHVCLFVFFTLDINSFVKPKMPHALKVLEVFLGKVIVWKQKSSVENKFTCRRNRPSYICGPSTLAFEWMWGWGWPCFDTNLLCFMSLRMIC